jgi:hypothetical protein
MWPVKYIKIIIMLCIFISKKKMTRITTKRVKNKKTKIIMIKMIKMIRKIKKSNRSRKIKLILKNLSVNSSDIIVKLLFLLLINIL